MAITSRDVFGVVNQILEMSGADVETRQRINDKCDQLLVDFCYKREEGLKLRIMELEDALTASQHGAATDQNSADNSG